jgi:DNA (cytosine-5)-methyltransferase 1
MKLKLLDLFSGIGGFSLGLESTGYFKTIAFVEKDKFCQQVLQKNFKDTPIESEVRNVKGDKYAADIITGGFPCQPFSVAGKRRGTDDDRYLWDETIRIIRECKPRWFIGENVEGIINIQEGMVLRQVQDDLEKEGFQVQCLVIPASGIGAWHQRKRVWILAYSEHNGSHRSKGNETIESSNQSKEWLFIGDDKDVSNTNSFGHRGWSSEGCTNERWSFLPREQEGREMGSETSRCDVDVLNTNSIRLQRRSIQSNNLQETSNSTETTNTSSKEQHTWWQAQSKLCGVPNGISYELDKGRSNRIKSLGNSIVPLIARELGIAIMKAEQDG